MADRSPDESWFPISTVSRMLRVSKQNFHASWKRHIPPSAIRSGGKGRETLIDTRALIDALLAHAREQERAKFADGDLVGDGSPSLERLRVARARLAELDLAERRRLVLSTDLMEKGLTMLGPIIRRVGEDLRRKFSNEAGDMLDAALEEFEREAATMFDNLRRGDGAAADAEEAADGR